MANPCVVSGNLQTLTANQIAQGKIIFQLTNIGTGNPIGISGTSIIPALNYSALSAPDGSFTVALWGNDVLTPSNTLYAVTFRDSQGNEVGPIQYSITGASANLNTLIAAGTVLPPVIVGQAIISAPSAPQSITGQSLTLTSTAPFITQGTGTHSGTETFTGSLLCKNLINVRCVSAPSGATVSDQGWAGTNAGAWITAAIADLPATGGTIDARGVQGTHTISANITFNKPVRLLLGAATITMTGSFLFPDDTSEGSQVVGTGFTSGGGQATILIAGSGIPLFQIGSSTFSSNILVSDLFLNGNSVAGAQAFVVGAGNDSRPTIYLIFQRLHINNFPGNNGTPSPGAFGLFGVQDSRFEDIWVINSGATTNNVPALYAQQNSNATPVQFSSNIFVGVDIEASPYRSFHFDTGCAFNEFHGLKFDNNAVGQSGEGLRISGTDNVFFGIKGIVLNNDAIHFEGPNPVRNQIKGVHISMSNSTSGTVVNMNVTGSAGNNSVNGVYVSALPAGTTGVRDVGTVANWYADVFLPAGGTAFTITNTKAAVLFNNAGTDSILSSVGTFPVTQTIASGTTTLTANAALAAVTSQAVVTTAGTGIAATDSIEWSYASAPGAGDSLCTVSAYVTAGNVNFVRSNPTAAAQNVSAIVTNWRVTR